MRDTNTKIAKILGYPVGFDAAEPHIDMLADANLFPFFNADTNEIHYGTGESYHTESCDFENDPAQQQMMINFLHKKNCNVHLHFPSLGGQVICTINQYIDYKKAPRVYDVIGCTPNKALCDVIIGMDK